VFDVIWPPGEPLVAECLRERRPLRRPWQKERGQHPAPNGTCECGIYALDDPFKLSSYLDSGYPRRNAFHRVIGRVSLWGTVIESERGWRASFAYPAHLFVPLTAHTPDGVNAYSLADGIAAYGVPVDVVPAIATPDILGVVAAKAA
jgi:hypothetical protein